MISHREARFGQDIVRLRRDELELLRQLVREARELGDDRLAALGMRRDEVDDLHAVVRTVHDQLADTNCTTLDVMLGATATSPAATPPGPTGLSRVTGMLSQATALRLPGLIQHLRDWLADPELGLRTGSGPADLDDLAARFPNPMTR
ncbi:hypothetical protein [Saccharothrix sp.]|uniref:hypothetical protein n=1 Tax=Saccharothrix sp. TaxID=1873460 RepID=UPI002811F372|nr:hypothetical protein [Saccharothrix sp.]